MNVAQSLVRLRRRAGLTQAELAHGAGTSQAAVARYEAGIVSPSMNTFERLVRAAGAEMKITYPKASVATLASKKGRLLRKRRKTILDLAIRAGASNVRVFGSVARGEDTPTSDIDLLVDYDTTQGLLPLVHLTRELKRLLKTGVDVSPVSMLKPQVAKRALSESIPL
jgi:predicted nucleotidyltransferase